MSDLYDEYQLEDTEGETFLKEVLAKLHVNLTGIDSLASTIPKTGPVIIAANHPFGGLEGVIMLHVITKVRPDIKVLANTGLSLFPQMAMWSIFTNPLKANNPKNAPSLRACKKHLLNDGALLLFPAGRVGYFRKDRGRIADHEWNRIISRFVSLPNVKYCPVYIHGQNSPLFYRLGKVWYRFRLLMLARELTNKHNASVSLHCSHANDISKTVSQMNDDEGSEFCRALSYIHHPEYIEEWPTTAQQHLKPIASALPKARILLEANALPKAQCLFSQGKMTAYFASADQIPDILYEITRRREIVFRMHNEGSGEPVDTDKFDTTYTHLFVIDGENGEVAGAYRMGQTDKLLATSGSAGLYLSQMFAFEEAFVNHRQPCLEMGRSFLMPAYQKSRLGLFMLWRAIGEFVVRHPQYKVLYGTVSLSKLYDKRSIKLIETLAVTKTNRVAPHASFDYTLSPEVQLFLARASQATDVIAYLDTWLSFTETDQKKLPVLLRQYASLGATFHCLGVDKNFADTPGLLLSVDLSQAPEKRLKQFLGPNWQKIAR
ncbi:lysophospholipid acyltransferase family protein [Alteromonas sediminis]|nr:lysophospholipid acyltransferase family protein [Alteromonas sediminis]